MLIRPIQKSDIPEVLDMGADMHTESRYHKYPLNAESCKSYAWAAAEGKANMMGVVAVVGGEVVGVILAYLVTHPVVHMDAVYDLIVYIQPNHRGGDLAGALIDGAYDHAKEQFGDVPVIFGISTNIHPEKTARLYQSRGFAPYSQSFIKE